MRIFVYTRGGQYISTEDLGLLAQLCEKFSIDCAINTNGDNFLSDTAMNLGLGVYSESNIDCREQDIILCYGGDGTILQAIARFGVYNTPILGINSGRLGFLASVPRSELETAIKAVTNGEYTIDERYMLEVKTTDTLAYAFNDFTLQKEALGMLNINLRINEEYVADYMADGLIISTPSGSTAYSMSVGGPIVAPNCSCYIVNPIAPHNLNMRPIIINDNVEIIVSGDSREGTMLATADNRTIRAVNGQKFYLKKSDFNIKMIRLNNTSFYKTIREKLMWGMDYRQILVEK